MSDASRNEAALKVQDLLQEIAHIPGITYGEGASATMSGVVILLMTAYDGDTPEALACFDALVASARASMQDRMSPTSKSIH